MMLTGELIDADTALAWGLANEVVEHDRLIDRCLALGEQIAGAFPISLDLQMRASQATAAAALAAGLEAERQALVIWDTER